MDHLKDFPQFWIFVTSTAAQQQRNTRIIFEGRAQMTKAIYCIYQYIALQMTSNFSLEFWHLTQNESKFTQYSYSPSWFHIHHLLPYEMSSIVNSLSGNTFLLLFLHNNFDGLILKHDFEANYLGVKLHPSLTYRSHIGPRLATRNNMLRKLAGTTWVASASFLRITALAMCRVL